MDDKKIDLEQELKASYDLNIKELEKQYLQERKNCLLPSRARELVLNPSLWKKEERKHADNCPHCTSMLKIFESQIEHPSLLILLLWILKRLKPNECLAMEYHVEESNCQRCKHLLQSPWLRSIASLFQKGKGTKKYVQERLSNAVVGYMQFPATVGTFASKKSKPFQYRAMHTDKILSVVIRESDEGEMIGDVRCSKEKCAGKKVRVEILGKKKQIEAEVVLKSIGEQGCVAKYSFGSFYKVLSQLGKDAAVLVSFVE